MEDAISHLVIIFIQTLSTACFCFFVLHDRLRISFSRLAVYTVVMGCFCSFLSIGTYWLCNYISPSPEYEPIALTSMLIIGFFCLRAITAEDSIRLLFVLYIAIHVQYLCLSVTYFIYSIWFPKLALSYHYSYMDIPGFTFPLLLFVPALAFVCRKIYIHLRQSEADVYHRIWIIPLLFILLYFLQVYFYPVTDLKTQAAANIIRIFVSLCAFITYSQMSSAIFQSAKISKEIEMRTQLAHQLDLQRSRMEDIETHIEEIRRIRHDRRQHIEVLKGMLEKGDLSQALTYLSDYEASVSSDIQPSLCENFVVSTLCHRYETLAIQSRIQVTLNLNLPQDIAIAGCDLAVIIGNLWENAIAAALDADKDYRFIRLWIQTNEDTVLIRMENGYGGSIHQEDGRFLSTKKNRNMCTGIGISSIQSMAHSYNGIADFSYTSEIFTASVLLYPHK